MNNQRTPRIDSRSQELINRLTVNLERQRKHGLDDPENATLERLETRTEAGIAQIKAQATWHI